MYTKNRNNSFHTVFCFFFSHVKSSVCTHFSYFTQSMFYIYSVTLVAYIKVNCCLWELAFLLYCHFSSTLTQMGLLYFKCMLSLKIVSTFSSSKIVSFFFSKYILILMYVNFNQQNYKEDFLSYSRIRGKATSEHFVLCRQISFTVATCFSNITENQKNDHIKQLLHF